MGALELHAGVGAVEQEDEEDAGREEGRHHQETVVERHDERLELDAEGAPKTNGDPRRIAQVLDNLLSNAIKFSSEGGSVTVEVRGNGQWTHVTVADTGIGIPAEEQAHVFSRFYRARAANELAVPGTGLGLAITRALVDQHGGSIGLESVEGAGTRVTVTLPAA